MLPRAFLVNLLSWILEVGKDRFCVEQTFCNFRICRASQSVAMKASAYQSMPNLKRWTLIQSWLPRSTPSRSDRELPWLRSPEISASWTTSNFRFWIILKFAIFPNSKIVFIFIFYKKNVRPYVLKQIEVDRLGNSSLTERILRLIILSILSGIHFLLHSFNFRFSLTELPETAATRKRKFVQEIPCAAKLAPPLEHLYGKLNARDLYQKLNSMGVQEAKLVERSPGNFMIHLVSLC